MALRSAGSLRSSPNNEPPKDSRFLQAVREQAADRAVNSEAKARRSQFQLIDGNQAPKPATIVQPSAPNDGAADNEPTKMSRSNEIRSARNEPLDAVHGDDRGNQMINNANSTSPSSKNTGATDSNAAASGGSAPGGTTTATPSQPGKPGSFANNAGARNAYANAAANGPIGRRIAGRTFDFASKHRKSLIAGGGGLGIVIALVISTIAFLPLKLESFMNNVIGYQEEKMQAYAEHRTKIIVYRYLFARLNGTLESDPMYTNSNIIKMLWGNMVKDQFEQKLMTAHNIKIERGSTAGSIRFTSGSGEVIEANDIGQLKEIFKTNPAGNSLEATISRFTENRYKGFRILQRRSVRYYLSKSYDVKRWGIDKKEDEVDKETKMHDTETQARSLALDGPNDKTIESLGCVSSPDDCQDEDPYVRSRDPNGDPSFKPVAAAPRNDEQREVQDESKKNLREQYSDLKTKSGKVIESILAKVIGETAAKAALKGLPIIGWVSLAADVDHFIWDGTWFKLGVTLRSIQYVTVAQTWASLKDQMKADELTASQINVLMQMIDGVEKSNAYQRTNSNNVDGGITIPEDKRVGTDSNYISDAGNFGICGITYATSPEFRGTPAEGYTMSQYEQWTLWYRRLTSPSLQHTSLCIIRSALDKVTDVIMVVIRETGIGALLSFFANITGLSDAINWVGEHLAELLGVIYEKIFGLVYNGEWGAPLGNAIDGGWEIIANNFLRDNLGAAMVSYEASYEQTTQFAAERQRNLAAQGPFASLLAWETPGSMGSRLLAALPATPASATNKFTSLASTLFLHPVNYFANTLQSFTPASLAVDPPSLKSPVGVVHYAIDKETLNDTNLNVAVQDINGPPDTNGNYPGPDKRIDIYDCVTPEGKMALPSADGRSMIATTFDARDPSKVNKCLTDTGLALGMCAGSGHSNDDGGIGSGGEPGPCGFVEQVQTSAPLTANWMSGASFEDGKHDLNPNLGTWRKSPVTIVGTWCDIPDCTDASNISAYDYFNGAVDVAIGGIFKQNGESWSAAASGAYNARWQEAINNIKTHRAGKGLSFVRFAHEANMDFSQWAVMPGEEAAYKTTFCNVATMAHAAGLKMTWSFNDGTLGGAATPIAAYPGDACVDVVGPDTYDWDTPHDAKTSDGSPIGIEAWRQFALSHGKPLAFPEWGANNTQGQTKDNSEYIKTMNEFMVKNAGSGPGQFIYDVYFNEDEGGYKIEIFPVGDVPGMSEMYQSLKWGS